MIILKRGIKNSILIGSALFFFANIFSSFFSYLFQLLSGRILNVADYGELVSLFSLGALITTPIAILNPAVVNKVAFLNAKGDLKNLTKTFYSVSFLMMAFSIITFFGLIIFSDVLYRNLKFSSIGVLFPFSIFVAIGIIAGIPNHFLNGLLRFKGSAFLSFFSNLSKLVFGIGLTLFIKNVYGSFLGLSVGLILTFVAGLFLLNKNLRFFDKENIAFKASIIRSLLKYSIPASFIIIPTSFLINMDIVIAKKIFDPNTAGIFAGISIIGKAIFYGISGISIILFPLISEKVAKGQDASKIFIKALLVIGAICIFGIAVYTAFPNLLVAILFGKTYFSAIPYLGIYSVFISIYSLINAYSTYFMASSKFNYGYILFIGLLIYFAGSLFFVSTIFGLIYNGIVSYSLILLASLWYHKKNGNKAFIGNSTDI